MPPPLVRRMGMVAKRYPADVRERATKLALDRLGEYGSAWAAARALGPKVGVGPETLRKWILAALADSSTASGMTGDERDEIKRLRAEVRELKEANEILKAASTFFVRALDPRRR
jgi:transposase-like protein